MENADDESNIIETYLKKECRLLSDKTYVKFCFIKYRYDLIKRGFIITYEDKIDYLTCRFSGSGGLIKLNQEGSHFLFFIKREDFGCPFPGEY